MPTVNPARDEIIDHICGGDFFKGLILRDIAKIPDKQVAKYGTDAALGLLECKETTFQPDPEIGLLLQHLGTSAEAIQDVIRRSVRFVVWGTLRNWEVTKPEAEEFFQRCGRLPNAYFVELAMHAGRYN